MSIQNGKPDSAHGQAADLELNKETLQDLDVEPADGRDVKGGGSSYHPSGGIAVQISGANSFSSGQVMQSKPRASAG